MVYTVSVRSSIAEVSPFHRLPRNACRCNRFRPNNHRDLRIPLRTSVIPSRSSQTEHMLQKHRRKSGSLVCTEEPRYSSRDRIPARVIMRARTCMVCDVLEGGAVALECGDILLLSSLAVPVTISIHTTSSIGQPRKHRQDRAAGETCVQCTRQRPCKVTEGDAPRANLCDGIISDPCLRGRNAPRCIPHIRKMQ
ncbi:hypothetical protein BV25DRAFT_1533529 [Artomyces pyxidatus]|uniref:Uncharacterized protein n=1 Tax=Artomyces pyxidatus TaxID=48021 RepID=A0ACB8SKX6_9AGAM|nr:hypothetical protein BV25DRAFT_1533529 [Artomyces pyxidatus]